MNDMHIAAIAIVCATLICLGMTGCQMNKHYQFRIGGYCDRVTAQDSWIKCDLLQGNVSR